MQRELVVEIALYGLLVLVGLAVLATGTAGIDPLWLVGTFAGAVVVGYLEEHVEVIQGVSRLVPQVPTVLTLALAILVVAALTLLSPVQQVSAAIGAGLGGVVYRLYYGIFEEVPPLAREGMTGR